MPRCEDACCERSQAKQAPTAQTSSRICLAITVARPSLRGGPAFSLSHTGGFALIGVTRSQTIGVDLEQVRPLAMSPRRREEIVAVGSLDPDCIHLPSIYVKRLILGAPYDKKIEFRTVREREAA